MEWIEEQTEEGADGQATENQTKKQLEMQNRARITSRLKRRTGSGEQREASGEADEVVGAEG
jgi:hypothetical protein